jgi:hypothetical protein
VNISPREKSSFLGPMSILGANFTLMGKVMFLKICLCGRYFVGLYFFSKVNGQTYVVATYVCIFQENCVFENSFRFFYAGNFV